MTISPKQRLAVIVAALLALFLGAMDALVVSAAMPTVVECKGDVRDIWTFVQ